MDSFIIVLSQLSHFVAKKEVLKIPFLSGILRCSNALFVNRESSSSKQETTNQIMERVEKIRESGGAIDPLVIYPEGGTTNGT